MGRGRARPGAGSRLDPALSHAQCRNDAVASMRWDATGTLATRRGCRTNPRFRPFAGGDWRMPQNFLEGRREQGFLLPPDVREWLPADHLAWFVIDAVAEMELSAFYGAYRADGHGRAAYEPSLMVALVL